MAGSNRAFSVRVTGIRELNRALKQIGDEYPQRMAIALVVIAGRVAAQIAAKVPRVSGDAAGSVKPQATARGGAVLVGGSKAPYFGWLDFGGTTGRGHKRGPNMGAIHREWLGRPAMGRYVIPTINEARPETIEALDGALREVCAEAGLETEGHI